MNDLVVSHNFTYGSIIKVTWFHEELAQVMKSQMSYSLTIT
jgi:hypothetical protein